MGGPRQILESTTAGFVAVLLAVLSVQAVIQFADVDLWGRLGLAALWTGSGKFPYHDVFSFTAWGAEWVDHEWLSGLIFYGVLRGFGETGLLLFKDLLITSVLLTIFCLHLRIYRVTSNYALLGILATIPLTSIGFRACIRCQVFSLLLFLLFLFWLEMIRLERKGDRAIFALIPFGILWANLHGGFLAGLLLILGYGAGRIWQERSVWAGRFYLATSGAIFAGSVINPYGLRYLKFLIHAWAFDRSDIVEWTPLWRPSADQWSVWLFIFLLVGLVFLRYFVWRQDREDVRALGGPTAAIALLIALTFMAYHRFQTFLAFGAVALLPVFLPPRIVANYGSPQFRRGVQHFVLMGALAFGIRNFTTQNSHPLTAPLLPIVFPVEAVNYLRSIRAQGNLVAPLYASEFMAWALYPRVHVAFDGRFEMVYRLSEIRGWLNFFRTPVSSATAQAADWPIAHGADWIITPNSTPGATISLMKNSKWTMEHQDDMFTLWHLHGEPRSEKPTDKYVESSIKAFFSADDLARFRQGH